MKKICFAMLAAAFLAGGEPARGAAPDWRAGQVATPEERANPYGADPSLHAALVRAGRLHAQIYPVAVTGMLPPYEPLRRTLEADEGDPVKAFFYSFFRGLSGLKKVNDVLRLVGLSEYPAEGASGVYHVPYPQGQRPEHRMGFGIIEHPWGRGFTLSCATCHAGRLFGRTVLGLNTRFSRANEVFVFAKKTYPLLPAWFFQAQTGATEGERKLFTMTQRSLRRVGAKTPAALGLDTSLAQVSLSLAKRRADAYATPDPAFESAPRPEPLAWRVADSKPSVWWNLKYKDRWLSDGSVLSGNPILTNILWNEIGRGTDLKLLEDWLAQNDRVIQELTTAVFAAEAPRYTDFFPAEKFPLEQARAGEKIFEARCAKCHGSYAKGWSAPDAASRGPAELLATTKVSYRSPTPVIDVGTDPARYQGMRSLEQLNELAISKNNGILVRAQKGYVPPPLVGIWARWPYFHNNSVPSLCALLTPGPQRPVVFYTGEPNDPATDFDEECNGYPREARVPAAWRRSPRHRFDTRGEGLGNGGHDERILTENGRELLSREEKLALVRYLQTL